MNSKYLCPKLKQLAELMYGGECFAKKMVNGKYQFGKKGKGMKNKNIVTKQAAIYLCINRLPKKKKK